MIFNYSPFILKFMKKVLLGCSHFKFVKTGLLAAGLFVLGNAIGQTELTVPSSLAGENGFGIENSRSSYTYASGDVINYFNAVGGADGSEISFFSTNLSSSTSNVCPGVDRRVQLNSFELVLNSTSASKIVLTGNSSGAGARHIRQLYINDVLVIVDGNDSRVKSFHPGGSATDNCADIVVEGLSVPIGGKIKIAIGGSATGSVQNFRVNKITITPDPLAPVRLLDFNAMRKNTGAEITWRVANESEGRSFGVERSSDGREFENIYTTEAAGHGRYIFVDNTPKPGRIAYYRLQMLNRDGSIAYSSIKAVNFDGKGALEVFPNPVRNGQLFTTFAPTTQNAMIRVLNASGQVLQAHQISPFTEQAQINTGNLRSGVYMLQIISGNDIQTTRFVKQ
jgi:hypothetical protein